MTRWYTVCLGSRVHLNLYGNQLSIEFTSYISDDLCLTITVCVSVGLPLLTEKVIQLITIASHSKVLINCSPVVLGGCAGLERSAFILTTLFPKPVTLGGCAGPGRNSVTVRAFVLNGFPSHSWPWHGFLLGVDCCCCLPPPCPLPLLACLPLNHHCLFCGLPGEGE